MRRRLLAAAGLAAVLLTGPLVPVRAAATAVEVHSDYFKAARVFIDPGDTVTWTAVNGGHTITADNGDFDFPPNAAKGGEVSPGDSFAATFPTRGVFYYHCRIHGAAGEYPGGMTGVVYVGIKPDEPTGEVRHVPADFPTIRAALSGIGPGSTVSLAPGTYHEDVQLAVAGLTLQGEGQSPSDVVLEGDGDGSPVLASADGITIRNLSVRGTRTAQTVDFNQASRFTIEDVTVIGGDEGVLIGGGASGVLRRVQSDGAATVGIAIVGCSQCGILAEGVAVSGAPTGLLLLGASDVVVRDLAAVDNGIGVDIKNGQGIDVTHSTVRGGTVGIDVSATVPPSLDVRVFDNTVTSASSAGLRWDLVGLRTCFSGNVDPVAPGGSPTTSPPMLQTLFPCA